MKAKLFLIIIITASMGFIIYGFSNHQEKESSYSSPNPNSWKPKWNTCASQMQPNPVDREIFYLLKGRPHRTITQGRLLDAQSLDELFPDYPYQWIKSYNSVKISHSSFDQTLSEAGTDQRINKAQKKLLQSAELSSEITIEVNYQTENSVTQELDDREMKITFVIIPEFEAQYPGGEEELERFLKVNSQSKITPEQQQDLWMARVSFWVDEKGKPGNSELVISSGYPDLDDDLIKLVKKMPNWEPAKDANGENVRQKLYLLIGTDGC